MKRILCSVAALALALSAASADSYVFTYTDGTVVANGTLQATGGLATSGVLDVTAGPSVGIYPLIPISALVPTNNPPGGYYITQPLNLWTVDDLIYPGQNPSLDEGGLLFGTSQTTSTNGVWINVFNDAIVTPGGPVVPPVGPYTFGVNDGKGVTYEQTTGSFTLSAVPEPGSIACLGIGALMLLRRRRPAR